MESDSTAAIEEAPVPRLLVNVWLRGAGYGPGFDGRVPPAELWAEVDAKAWEVAPAAAAVAGFVPPTGGPVTLPALEELEEDPPAWEGPTPTDLADAGEFGAADPLEELRAAAEAVGVAVDGRWGVKRLQREIDAARAGAGPDA